MKAAISTEGEYVSAHFGRCPSFTIVDIEDGAVKQKSVIENPGHHPGFLPQFLKEQNVECIVAGGMGQRAKMLFDEQSIAVTIGVTGSIADVVEQLAQGALVGGESLCSPGAGKGYGVEKTECDHGEDKHC